MANLIALPTELKEAIVNHTQPTDRLNIAKTCRVLRDIAYPALYRNITIRKWSNDGLSENLLIRLIRTLIEESALARHVRKVEFLAEDDARISREGVFEDYFDEFSEHDKNLLIDAVRTPGLSGKIDFDTLATLILLKCEKVEDLVIESNLWPTSLISAIQGRPLNNLTVLRLRQSTVSPDSLERFLAHTPNLKILEYDFILPSSDTPLDCNVLRKALHHTRHNLKDLVVKYDLFADQAEDPENLSKVCAGSLGPLKDFPELEKLHVSFSVLYGQKCEADAPLLADVLPASLRHLTIGDDMWGYDAFAEWEGRQIMAVFKAFFSGEKRIDGEWNAEKEDYDHTWKRIGEPGWKSATPKLENFVFDIRKRGSELYYCWEDEQDEELKRICEEQGIKCEVLEKEYDD